MMTYGLRTFWSIFINHKIVPACDSDDKFKKEKRQLDQ